MSKSVFNTTNPATGEHLAEYQRATAAQIDHALNEARAAYKSAKTVSVSKRSALLQVVAKALRARSTDLSRSMSLEMGKPVKDAAAEVEKSAGACDWFAESLPSLLREEATESSYSSAKIVKDSIGPVLAIMPWNFPLWQTIRFAAPAVGIGNPILLKHSNLVAGTAEMIAECFAEASQGLLFNLAIDHEQAAVALADPRVAAVTLTGSAGAGREVAQVAGKFLKKSVLELGGSDAYIVLHDADVEHAARICAQARMVNAGQSCVAAKRFVVHRSIAKAFLNAFTHELRALPHGDPLDEKTKVGCLAAKTFQKQLLEQCTRLEKEGAELSFDLAKETGFSFAGKDAFFPARVYRASVDANIPFTEEFFGPVAIMFEFEETDEALAIANKSIYGLGGAVFSADINAAEKLARGMEAGFVAINEQVKSDARLPFGGVKESGYGRELSRHGFDEFCNIKTLGFGKTQTPDQHRSRSTE